VKAKVTSEPKRSLAARAFTAVEDVVYHLIIELAVLPFLVVALVLSLVLLRKREGAVVAERAI